MWIALRILSRIKRPVYIYWETLSRGRHLRSRNEILGSFEDFGRKKRNMNLLISWFHSLQSVSILGNRDGLKCLKLRIHLRFWHTRQKQKAMATTQEVFRNFGTFWEARTKSQKRTYIFVEWDLQLLKTLRTLDKRTETCILSSVISSFLKSSEQNKIGMLSRL